jgi:hypothetical protein
MTLVTKLEINVIIFILFFVLNVHIFLDASCTLYDIKYNSCSVILMILALNLVIKILKIKGLLESLTRKFDQ